MQSPRKAHVFILAANVLYGLNYSIGKAVLGSIPPFAVVAVRVLCGLAAFWMIHALFVREKTKRADHIKLLLCGVCGVAINQMLFFKGLSLTSEIHSALIMITTPMLVLIMAWILLHDRITPRKAGGIACGAAGVCILVLSAHAGASETASAAGDICIMINAASYAVFLVLAKPLMRIYHPLTITKWIFFYGMLFVMPVSLPSLVQVHWHSVPGEAYASLAYVVICATVLAYLFNVTGLHYGNPVLVSVYIYTQPVIATAVAVLVHGEALNMLQVISAILVFGGVFLVSFPAQARRAVQDNF